MTLQIYIPLLIIICCNQINIYNHLQSEKDMAKFTKERWHARGYSYEADVAFKKCLYLVVVQIKRCKIIQRKMVK